MSDMMFVLASQALDITAPTVPSGVSVTAQNGSNALSWTASTDNVAVDYYQLWGGNTSNYASMVLLQNNINDTVYSDTTYTQNVRRYYYIKAVDTSGNVSGNSSIVDVINTTAPM